MINYKTLKTFLDCDQDEFDKFVIILDFCKKFDKNALDNAISLTHQYNFCICLDNVLKFMIDDLIDNLINTIYKDIKILVSIDDFSIAIDTDNILNTNDNIVLTYEDDNTDVFNWIQDNCNGFVEY